MGETMSRIQQQNNCFNDSKYEYIPRYHYKARFHKEDQLCGTHPYTRTKDVFRCPVPIDKIKWETILSDYKPVNFSSAKILTKDGLTWKDPDIIDPDFSKIQFNQIDKTYNCDRQSYHGPYKLIEVKVGNKNVLVPQNPVGRTGLTGRGHLGRWACNHAADPIVTTWSRDANGKIKIHPLTKKPILKFVAIQRRDTGEWAIPGGMRDPGEMITKTLVREFAEEALDHQLSYDKNNKINKSAGRIEEELSKFFKRGIQIYKGYVDDPRNTDNSWIETIACNFHDETGDLIGLIPLKGGDDATNAKWIELSSELKLFASHHDFIENVASRHDAHWSSDYE